MSCTTHIYCTVVRASCHFNSKPFYCQAAGFMDTAQTSSTEKEMEERAARGLDHWMTKSKQCWWGYRINIIQGLSHARLKRIKGWIHSILSFYKGNSFSKHETEQKNVCFSPLWAYRSTYTASEGESEQIHSSQGCILNRGSGRNKDEAGHVLWQTLEKLLLPLGAPRWKSTVSKCDAPFQCFTPVGLGGAAWLRGGGDQSWGC